MQIAQIITNLRKEKNLSQEDLAQKLFVTRQAVSKWECGKAEPESDIMVRISGEFGIPLTTLMGAPEQVICQSCGWPFPSTEHISKFNENYCEWCYDENGLDQAITMDDMVQHVINMGGAPKEFWPDEATARRFLNALLPELERWRA